MSHSSRIPRSVISSSPARCGASLLLGALALLPASGCEDTNAGGGQPNTGGEFTWPAAKPVAKGDYASTVAETHCSSIADCCRSGGFAFDEADCVRNARALFTALVDDMSSKPNRTYDDAAAGRCVEALRAMNTACNDRAIEEALEDGCRGVFAGVLPLGAACTMGSECAEGQGQDVYCNEGKCTLSDASSRPRGVRGDVCIGSCEGEPDQGDYCSNPPDAEAVECWRSDGVYCSHETRKCEALAAPGEACIAADGEGTCVDGARCQEGACVASANGDACRGPGDRSCPGASNCDLESSTCQPRKVNGQACRQNDGCLSLSCRSGLCAAFTVASEVACSGFKPD